MCQAPPLSVPSRPSLGFVVQTSSSSPCSRAALLPPLPLLLPTAGSTPPFPRAVAHASPYHASSLSSAPAHVVHLRAPVQHVLAFIVWSCSSKIWTSSDLLARPQAVVPRAPASASHHPYFFCLLLGRLAGPCHPFDLGSPVSTPLRQFIAGAWTGVLDFCCSVFGEIPLLAPC